MGKVSVCGGLLVYKPQQVYDDGPIFVDNDSAFVSGARG
jgi:hypothetical protein